MNHSDAPNPNPNPADPFKAALPDSTLLLLELYVDGSLDESQRGAFEAALAGSPALRAMLELEQQIAGSLKRQYTPPAASVASPAGARDSVPAEPLRLVGTSASLPRESVGGSDRAARPGMSLRRVGLAAAACLLIGVGVLGITFYSAMHSGAERVRPTLAAVYSSTLASGFVPAEVCTTDEAFAGWMKEKFGTALAPSRTQARVEFVGWSYSTAISPYTGVLLARVEGEPVLVFIDTLENERKFGGPKAALESVSGVPARAPTFRPRGSGTPAEGTPSAEEEPCPDQAATVPLQLHRHEVAGLVMYEVSPFGEARIVTGLEVR